jgi:hypothetical protein
MSDHADLRAAAEAASEGPWGSEPPSRERATIHHIIRERVTGPQVANVLLDEDAAYIALASPDHILALLDDSKALRAALERIKSGLAILALDLRLSAAMVPDLHKQARAALTPEAEDDATNA